MNKFFKIKERGSSIFQEIMGGLIVFLAISYILPVNANILSVSIIIGFITFINSLLGYIIGYGLKRFNSKALEIFGGILLITLAIKNLM